MGDLKHIYNSGLAAKFAWFGRRFGYLEMLLKPTRYFFSPLIYPLVRTKKFTLDGKTYEQHKNRNSCVYGDRSVEVPYFTDLVYEYEGKRILEVGNVLGRYLDYDHDCVDKYEKAKGVINCDITEFVTSQKYDLIISISTFEHIGYDDDGDSATKIPLARAACRSMLAKGGRLTISVPYGYNDWLDTALLSGLMQKHCDDVAYLSCRAGQWVQRYGVTRKMIGMQRDNWPYANQLAILTWEH